MSCDLPTGKLFLRKLLYVQHVNQTKDETIEITESEFKLNVLDNSLKFRDKNFEFPRDKFRFSGESVLEILKDCLPDPITHVWVYSNPLPSLPAVSVLIHAFVVFTTKKIPLSNSGEMWWSLEKNGKYIILQQSPNKTDVVDTTYDVNQGKIDKRLLPVEELTSAKGSFSQLTQLLESLLFSSQLGIPYHLLFANCQRFASYVFGKANGEGKTWSTAASGKVPNEKESLFGVGADTIRYNSIQSEYKRIPYYQAIIDKEEMPEFERILANYTSESINQVDAQGYTFLEWAEAFSRDNVKNYLIKEKDAAESELHRRNVFFIALQYLDSKDELKDPKLSFDGIDITGVNRMGDTPLHLALYGGKWEVTKKILKEMKTLSMPVYATNLKRETALHLIAKLNCPTKTFKKILEQFPLEKIEMADEQGLNALHWATISGSTKKIKLLLKKGANIDAQTDNGQTALHLALRDELRTGKSHKVVKKLLKCNAGNIKDADNCTPLHHAVLCADDLLPPELFKEILERFPVDVNHQDKEGDTPFMVAVFNQSDFKARELLKCSDVNVKNRADMTALHYAVTWPNVPVDMFKEILSKSADMNAQDSKGHTPLVCALINESATAALQLLLVKGVDVNIKDNENEMAIHWAVRWKTIPGKILQLIIEKTEEINAQIKNGKTALHLTCQIKSKEAVKLLLDHLGIEVNVKDQNDWMPLHTVCSLWPDVPLELLHSILQKTNDVNAVTKDGNTALIIALIKQSKIVVKELLEHKKCVDGTLVEVINVNVKGKNDYQAIHCTARWPDIPMDLLKLILAKTTDINAKAIAGHTPLHCALINNSETAVRELLKHETIDVNVTNDDKRTGLHLASIKCPDIPNDLFQLILTKSPNINAQDNDGNTALHMAIANKSSTKAWKLLEIVDVNTRNNRNATVLQFACTWPEIPADLFREILDKTDDIDAQFEDGSTALQCALMNKSETAVRELLNHAKDVNVNIKNKNQTTALHFAVGWSEIPVDLFRLILEKTDDINAQDKNGKTAIDLASANQSQNLIPLLEERIRNMSH